MAPSCCAKSLGEEWKTQINQQDDSKYPDVHCHRHHHQQVCEGQADVGLSTLSPQTFTFNRSYLGVKASMTVSHEGALCVELQVTAERTRFCQEALRAVQEPQLVRVWR